MVRMAILPTWRGRVLRRYPPYNPNQPITAPLLFLCLEIAQVRRRLTLPGRHQIAVGAEKIILAPDLDVTVAFRANLFEPLGSFDLLANVFLGHRPRARKRVVDRGDFVGKDVGLILVPGDSLLDDALV